MHIFSKEHCSFIMARSFCSMRFLFLSLDYLWNAANSVRKLNVLARIVNYMELPKRCIFMNAFLKSQFNYCRAIWMFHNRALNNKINGLHEIYIWIIYNDKLLNFEELLHQTPDKNNTKANFQENLPDKVRFQNKWGDHGSPGPPLSRRPVHEVNSVSIHRNNIHALAIEMYKVVNGMSPEMKFPNKETIPIIL